MDVVRLAENQAVQAHLQPNIMCCTSVVASKGLGRLSAFFSSSSCTTCGPLTGWALRAHTAPVAATHHLLVLPCWQGQGCRLAMLVCYLVVQREPFC